MRIFLVGALIFAVTTSVARATVGDVDTSFGSNGTTTIRYPDATNDQAAAVVAQSTGRTIVVATSDAGTAAQRRDPNFKRLMLVRLRPSGAIDRDFGRNGRLLMTLTGATALNAVDAIKDPRSDGFYVLAKVLRRIDLEKPPCRARALFDCYDLRHELAVLRFRADGSADRRWSRDGVLTIAAGRERRGGEGGQDIDVPQRVPVGIAVSSQGRVFIADRAFSSPAARVIRLKSDGSGFDGGFGANGQAVSSIVANDLIIDSSGRPLLSGRWESSVAVTRFTASGQRDPAFGQAGRVTHSFVANDPAGDSSGAAGIAQLGPGAYVTGGTLVTGFDEEFLFATRLRTADGRLDNAFNTNGFNLADFRDLAPGGAARARGQHVVIGFGGRVVVGGEVTLEAHRPIQQGPPRYQLAFSVFTGDGDLLRRRAVDIRSSYDESLRGFAVERDGDVVAAVNVDLDSQECCAIPRIAVLRFKAR